MKRRQQEIRTNTAADVDHGGAWRQRRDRMRIPHAGERLGHRPGQPCERGSVVVEPSGGVLRPAVKMELAGRILGNARINGLNFRTQLERVEIDRTGNRHALTTPFYGLGCGTIRMYGLGAFQPCGYVVLASSSDTEPAMITSSPCFPLTGVATLCLAVSCKESPTRSTSPKWRHVLIG